MKTRLLVGLPGVLVIVTACGSPSVTESTAPSGSATPSTTASLQASQTIAPSASVFGDAPVMAVRAETCEHDSGVYRVEVPDGWWVNPAFTDSDLGPTSACRFFAPETFDVTTGDRDRPQPAGAAISVDFIDGGCIGYIHPILSTRPTEIDGFEATITELGSGTEPSGPPFTYEYAAILAGPGDCVPEDKAIRAVTSRDMAGDYDENVAALDQIIESMEVALP
jgi:hypothetical protein